ncbi:MAG: anthranilate phosphoribosyltransferase [Thermodesulfobacteriota bacterium]
MPAEIDRNFGALISRLARHQDLTREESSQAFSAVLNDATTSMQQGAFLAALATKGETGEEMAGAWEAIFNLDTVKINLLPPRPLVENSGTGMDAFKTFNISTAAAVIAAAGGLSMARHGARAITSACGTVDMAEAVGVDVECPVEMVAESIARAGIGLFNGMSPTIHPGSLARILSQIHFGSILNIAASLANPAMPVIGVRGVYSEAMILPVVRLMKSIGYKKAIGLYGTITGLDGGMDEASVCGPTHCAELRESGDIRAFTLYPEDYGLRATNPQDLAPSGGLAAEARRFVSLLQNRENGIRKDAVLLNAALVFYAAGTVSGIDGGLQKATRLLENGQAFATLTAWVAAQNREPEKGLRTLERLADPGCLRKERS